MSAWCSLHRTGVKSGDWLLDDKIFTGRLMIVDCGKACELRLTDGNTCAVDSAAADEWADTARVAV